MGFFYLLMDMLREKEKKSTLMNNIMKSLRERFTAHISWYHQGQ